MLTKCTAALPLEASLTH